MPRLFTALKLPTSIAMRASLLQSGLPGANWIDRENLHLTLHFIGDVELPIAREVATRLESVKTEPFELSFENLDVFGGSKPRSLYIGTNNPKELYKLQSEHKRICYSLGLETERRKFKPHITLARVRNASPVTIAHYLSANGGFKTDPILVKSFSLLSSRDSVGGGPYITQTSYELLKKESTNA